MENFSLVLMTLILTCKTLGKIILSRKVHSKWVTKEHMYLFIYVFFFCHGKYEWKFISFLVSEMMSVGNDN